MHTHTHTHTHTHAHAAATSPPTMSAKIRQSTLGGYFSAQRPATTRNSAGLIKCNKCERAFESPQGLAGHVRFNHGFGQPATQGPNFGNAKVVKDSAKATGSFKKGVRVADGATTAAPVVNRAPAPKPQPQPQPLHDDGRRSRQRNLTAAECLRICAKAEYYMSAQAIVDGVEPGQHWANTAKWARDEFHRDPFTSKQAKVMYQAKEKYEKVTGSKARVRRTTAPASKSQGAYPGMEVSLALWIRQLRAIGFPCETFMVDIEAKEIFKKLYPQHCNEAGEPTFKFSQTWRTGFFTRHGFTLRKVTTKSASARMPDKVNEVVAAFHKQMRTLQMSGDRDPVYGFCEPWKVWNHDQVPIALAAASLTTAENVGSDVVFDSTSKGSDSKRFCTLNLFIPMLCVMPDVAAGIRGNYSRPCVMFQAKEKEGDDWFDEAEREKWGDCHVTFNPHAWADQEQSRLALINWSQDLGFGTGTDSVEYAGVFTEDNLGSHKTPMLMDWWEDNMPQWVHRYYPPNLTWCLQPVDRHVGIVYKLAVYQAIRTCIMRKIREQEAKIAAQDTSVLSEIKLSASEKRIIITQTIARVHKARWEHNSGKAFWSAFTKTGTWVDVAHLLNAKPDGEGGEVQHGPDDEHVFLQGLTSRSKVGHSNNDPCTCKTTPCNCRYLYADHITRESVLQYQAEEDAARVVADEVKRADEQAVQHARDGVLAVRAARAQELRDEVATGDDWWQAVKGPVEAEAANLLAAVGARLKQDFVLAGSYLPSLIAKHLSRAGRLTPPLVLTFDDVDVYCGGIGDGPLHRTGHQHETLKVDGQPDVDLNVVKGTGISMEGLAYNADINAVAVCAQHSHAAGTTQYEFNPEFWEFMQSRVIRAISAATPTITAIRAFHKGREMKLAVDEDTLQVSPQRLGDKKRCVFYASQHAKLLLLRGDDGPTALSAVQTKLEVAGNKGGKPNVWRLLPRLCTCGKGNRLTCYQYLCSNCCKESPDAELCKTHHGATEKRKRVQDAERHRDRVLRRRMTLDDSGLAPGSRL